MIICYPFIVRIQSSDLNPPNILVYRFLKRPTFRHGSLEYRSGFPGILSSFPTRAHFPLLDIAGYVGLSGEELCPLLEQSLRREETLMISTQYNIQFHNTIQFMIGAQFTSLMRSPMAWFRWYIPTNENILYHPQCTQTHMSIQGLNPLRSREFILSGVQK